MRVHRQVDVVPALIGIRIGIPGRPQQADPDLPVEHAVPVPPVVEDGHSETGLGDVDVAVCAHLELGRVPRRRRMGRAPDAAELHVARRHVGAHVERESHRQQVLVLVPVDLDVDVEARAAGAQ